MTLSHCFRLSFLLLESAKARPNAREERERVQTSPTGTLRRAVTVVARRPRALVMDRQEVQLQKRCAWAVLDRTACIAVLLDDVALH